MNDDALLPCPFCGGEPTAIETHPGRGELYCGTCDVVLGGNNAMTPEELTAAWNTRTEMGSGTCEMEPSFIEPSRLDFMQEYLCSECGEYSYMQIACDGDGVNYCPNCGRKVVSE